MMRYFLLLCLCVLYGETVHAEYVSPDVKALAEISPEAGTPQNKPAYKVEDELGNVLASFIYDAEQTSIALANISSIDIIAKKLKEDINLRIRIDGYASMREGVVNKDRRIAFQRVLAIRNYLIKAGVDGDRIIVRALGDAAQQAPFDRVDIYQL